MISQSATKASTTGSCGLRVAGLGETLSIRSGTTGSAASPPAPGSRWRTWPPASTPRRPRPRSGSPPRSSPTSPARTCPLASQNYGSAGSFDFCSTGTGTGSDQLGRRLDLVRGARCRRHHRRRRGDRPGPDPVGADHHARLRRAGPADHRGRHHSGSSVSLGTFNYNPGVAAQMEGLSEHFADPINGTFAFSITQLAAQNKGLTSQISRRRHPAHPAAGTAAAAVQRHGDRHLGAQEHRLAAHLRARSLSPLLRQLGQHACTRSSSSVTCPRRSRRRVLLRVSS